MSQPELIAETVGSDKAKATRGVDAVLGLSADPLKLGEKVSLSSLGIFEINERKARRVRNPSTRESIHIAARKAIEFPPMKSPKYAVSPPAKSMANPEVKLR